MRPTIAILGASTDRAKFGNKAVRAYLRVGYQVFAVNPNAVTVEGLTAYPSLKDVPAVRLDRVAVYLPASVMLRLLDDFPQTPIGEVIFNPGADDPEVLEVANKATQHLYIVNPIKAFEKRSSSMWDTHPPLAERIAVLEGLAGAGAGPVPISTAEP